MLNVHSDNEFIDTSGCARRIQIAYILKDLEDGEKTDGEIYFWKNRERERQTDRQTSLVLIVTIVSTLQILHQIKTLTYQN